MFKYDATMSLTPLSKVPDFIFFCLVGLYTFFLPIYEQLIFLNILIIFDLLSGLALARHYKQPIKYKKLFTTAKKMVYFGAIVLVGFIMDEIFVKVAFGEAYMFSIFMLLLALSEFKSIVNNFGRILGIDIWSKVIKAFKKDVTVE